MKKVIEMKNVRKDYIMGTEAVHALRDVDFSVSEGEFVAIMGASGSGKSTLMNIIGCLDVMDSGEYYLDSINIKGLQKDDYSKIRNQKIGFVFQGFNLLARTTALENVELPLLYNKSHQEQKAKERAKLCLEQVGLAERIYHEPKQLSGGQQQRVAIARALVNQPAILLADEPTGNLDSIMSIEIMKLFQELNNQGLTIILVTHEHDIAQYTSRKVQLFDGKIIADEPIINRLDAVQELKRMKETS